MVRRNSPLRRFSPSRRRPAKADTAVSPPSDRVASTPVTDASPQAAVALTPGGSSAEHYHKRLARARLAKAALEQKEQYDPALITSQSSGGAASATSPAAPKKQTELRARLRVLSSRHESSWGMGEMRAALDVAGIEVSNADKNDRVALRTQIYALAEHARVQWELEAAAEAARAAAEAEAAERKLAASRKFRRRSRLATPSKAKIAAGDVTDRIDEDSDEDDDIDDFLGDDDEEELTLSDDEDEGSTARSMSFRARMRARGAKPRSRRPASASESTPMEYAWEEQSGAADDDALPGSLLPPALHALLVPEFARGTPWAEAVGKCATCVPRARPAPAVRMW